LRGDYVGQSEYCLKAMDEIRGVKSSLLFMPTISEAMSCIENGLSSIERKSHDR